MALRAISAVQECPNHRVHRCDLARLGRTTGTDRPNGFISDRELAPRRIIVERIGQLTTYIIGGAVAFFGRFADAQDRSDRKSTRLTPVTNAHLVCRLLL